MKNRNLLILIFTLLCALLLTGCSSTTLTKTWKEANYSKTSSKILILGMTKTKRVRQVFEAKLTAALKKHGTSAYAGYLVFNYDEILEKSIIVDYVKKNAIDSVLVTKVLDTETYAQRATQSTGSYREHFGPVGSGSGWYGNYSAGQTATNYETEFQIYNLETSLYAVDTEKVVWSAFTQMEVLDRNMDNLDDLVRLIVTQLKQDGFI